MTITLDSRLRGNDKGGADMTKGESGMTEEGVALAAGFR
jgi:hypothetical protein